MSAQLNIGNKYQQILANILLIEQVLWHVRPILHVFITSDDLFTIMRWKIKNFVQQVLKVTF